MANVVASPLFNFTTTYFMVAGIAGVNPYHATTGSVMINRYAVQVALQYEIAQPELGDNYTFPYIPLGGTLPAPAEYPVNSKST
jgi:purine nucleoside permease